MEDKYLTVSALTKYIKQKLDTDPHLNDVWLRGEISNFTHHSRGHMYLTIKDDNSRIQSVMFAGYNRHLKFTPENGMNVLLRGSVSVFEPFGQYQFYIKQMEPDGVGALHLAFEQLKEKLKKQGFFKEEAKKEIPSFPKHIGIVTSKTGAAVRDIITTIKRRYPIVDLTVIPVQVQGEGATESIVSGIKRAQALKGCDLLIVGRGGGSIEDLWAFNEEKVARAIFYSEIPIISAVGHETDVTIADFVSDLRAPTPTGAAELAVPSQIELNEKYSSLNKQLLRNISLIMRKKYDQLARLKHSLQLQTPKKQLEQKEQRFDYQYEKLTNAMQTIIMNKKNEFDRLTLQLKQTNLNERIQLARQQLNHLTKEKRHFIIQQYKKELNRFQNTIEHLILVNPLNVMKRGFSIAYDEAEQIIKSTKNIEKQDRISLKVYDGKIICEVEDVWREKDDE